MKKYFLLLLIFFNFLFANSEESYLELIKPNILKIESLDKNIITINKGNLQKGKTGIVIHVYENKEKIIVGSVKVISSNKNDSKLLISQFTGLNQDSIPTTKRKPSIGDVIVLGYLYDKSMVITPDVDTFSELKQRYFLNSFLHPDVFGAVLKVDNGKYPTKEQIQTFAISQNLGTIFIVVNSKIYVLDSKSFKKIETFDIVYDTKKEYTMPFYTRIEDIESSITGISFSDEKLEYEKHYKSLLGIK